MTDLAGTLACVNSAPRATYQSHVGLGINSPVLNATPAVIGQPFTAEVMPVGHANAGWVLFFLRGAVLNSGIVVSIFGGPQTELLVTNPVYADYLRPHQGEGAPPALLSLQLPFDLSLLGLPWAMQAAVVSDYIDLSTAGFGTIGG